MIGVDLKLVLISIMMMKGIKDSILPVTMEMAN